MPGRPVVAVIGSDDFQIVVSQSVIDKLEFVHNLDADNICLIVEEYAAATVPREYDSPVLRLSAENLSASAKAIGPIAAALHHKQQLDTLAAKNAALMALNGELEAKLSRRTAELAQANTQLAQQSITDGLTGLFSHRQFKGRLPLEIERSVRNGLPLCLLLLDVDGFRKYNEEQGYGAGDDLLRELASILHEGQRANDYCCRYGGDELAVALVDTSKLVGAKVAERLRKRIQDLDSLPAEVTISVGVAAFPDDGENAASLTEALEKAAKQASAQGGNCVVLA